MDFISVIIDPLKSRIILSETSNNPPEDILDHALFKVGFAKCSVMQLTHVSPNLSVAVLCLIPHDRTDVKRHCNKSWIPIPVASSLLHSFAMQRQPTVVRIRSLTDLFSD